MTAHFNTVTEVSGSLEFTDLGNVESLLYDDYWYSKTELITEFTEWFPEVSAMLELDWDFCILP